MGLDSRPNARVVDAWVVRTQTRQADCLKCIHLPGAPRGHGIAVAAADVRRIGATDFGTAKLTFGHLCYLPEVRAPRDTGRRKFGPTEFPHPSHQRGRVGGSGRVVPGVSWPPPDGEVFDPGTIGPVLVGAGAVLGGKLTPGGAPKRRGQ